MCKDPGRELHAHTNVHTIGFCADIQIMTYLLHPLASASSGRNYTILSIIEGILMIEPEAVFQLFHSVDHIIEVKLHFVLQMRIQMLQNNVVDIRSQMTNGRIQ